MYESLINGVRNIQNMIKGEYRFETEQATKQGLILPLLQALGYNIFNVNEVTPEAVADVGVKKGEKVDFKISIDNKIMMIIECKKKETLLSNKDIEQLYRYYATGKVKLAILTNGDDYWFFTDSTRQNIMDNDAYSKIKISDLSTDEEIIKSLDKYRKSNIEKLDARLDVRNSIVKVECRNLVNSLINGEVPDYVVEAVANKLNIQDINEELKFIITYTFNRELLAVYDKKKISIKENTDVDQTIKTPNDDIKDNIKSITVDKVNRASNIKLNYECPFLR